MVAAVENLKLCSHCKQVKPISEFHKSKDTVDGFQYKCKSCQRAYQDTDQHRAKARAYYQRTRTLQCEQNKDRHDKLKSKFFEMYGNVCACCGESELAFLSIEHKHGIRPDQKRGRIRDQRKEYREAIQEYRPDLFETLCMNCNHAKGRLGTCPHQSKGVFT